jgi:Domain of unknown function (DUF4252)
MKKLFTPLLAVLFTFTACAQDTHLDQFYQKFNSGENETSNGTINLSLLLNLSSSSNPADTGWWTKITLCRFLTIDQRKTAGAGKEWSELNQSLKDDHFEEWMSVRHGKENFRMLARDRKDGQEDVVCVAIDEKGSGVFFHLRGRFSAADKDRIGAALQDHHS